MDKDIIPEPIEFEWNKGNIDKNLKKHGLRNEEAEEAFLKKPLVYYDKIHSKIEKRYDCLGVTDKGKKLFISFTIRSSKIRIISARQMSKKERKIYEQEV
ncbi:hypothetical protein A2188_03185 [Candidatus Woesebacteria bacterium RIFOXYA1_FULL_43_9]|uniref:BrnT family toxin n=1 Tax=Candidatus Woesebacteria bacterium RIFOXYA1_FULL_43_9 TaxID=1802534 RepID=A0A1F8CLY4_9BACT|nr:MAG: hypothetical protein A2188_03185 [Candidatus Woesebacteria bacterium RIFOXYA1_FULL_43_9]